MGEVIERRNPLVDHMNAIAALNAQHGTRAEGGTGVPVSAEPPAVKGGVSLPAAEVLTPEDEAKLKAEYEAQWGGQGQPTPTVAPPAQVATQNLGPARTTTLTDFVLFDLRRGVVVADNGEEFSIPEPDVKALKKAAFDIAVWNMNKQITALASTLGITLPKGETSGEQAGEKTPGKSEVPSEPKGPESGLGA